MGEDLTGEHDLMVDSAMNSDLFGGPGSGLTWSEDGRWISFTAPIDGAYEAWRVEVGAIGSSGSPKGATGCRRS